MALESLDKLQLTPDHFLPFSRDGESVKPAEPIKPKARLIMVLSVAAFFAEFLARARESEEQLPG
jgi:hypothetical protein